MAGLPVIHMPEQKPYLAEAISGGVRGFMGGMEHQRGLRREKKEDVRWEQEFGLKEQRAESEDLRNKAWILSQIPPDMRAPLIELWGLTGQGFEKVGVEEPKPVRGKTFTGKPSEVSRMGKGFFGREKEIIEDLSPGQEIIAEMIRDVRDAQVVVENPQHFMEMVKGLGYDVSIEDVKAVGNAYRTPEMLKATTTVDRPPSESIMGRFGQGFGPGVSQFLKDIPGTVSSTQMAPSRWRPGAGAAGQPAGPFSPVTAPVSMGQPSPPPSQPGILGGIGQTLKDLPAGISLMGQMRDMPSMFRMRGAQPTPQVPPVPQVQAAPREVDLQVGIGAERTIRARFKANGKVYNIPADKFNPDEWERL